MATSYKIRLKRFNGTDYDILNLVSSNIIMNTGNTLQSDIVPITNGIIKNNNGVFQIATLGTDYGALSFTITLASNGWNNNQQTISNVNFMTSGFSYIVSPNSTSLEEYGECGIYADDISINGNMTFHCTDVPSSNLTVNVVRVVTL